MSCPLGLLANSPFGAQVACWHPGGSMISAFGTPNLLLQRTRRWHLWSSLYLEGFSIHCRYAGSDIRASALSL